MTADRSTPPDWTHPVDPRFADAPRRDLGVAHRSQLIVDERDWPAVRAALDETSVAFRHLGTAYGLVRLALAECYEDAVYQMRLLAALQERFGATAARLGRNRLLAHACLQFDDDDAVATPKVAPSAAGAAEPAPATFPGLVAAEGDPEPGSTVRVGVVDTAFAAHAFLAGRCTYAPAGLPALLTDEGSVGGTSGHATFVAGLIHQVAPAAAVHVESVVTPHGLADMVDVHDAICRLVEAGVHVVNLSLGCVTADDELPFVLDHALGWAARRGLPQPVFVAAAGNTGSSKPFWPAADPRVRSVAGAVRGGDGWQLAPYSGHGDWVSVAAPSDDVCGPRPYLPVGAPVEWDRYAYWSGTSFATAIVTGLTAAQLGSAGPVGLIPPHDWAAPLRDPADSIKNGPAHLDLYGTQDVTFKPS